MKYCKSGCISFANGLAANQKLSYDELCEYNHERRKQLVLFAYNNIPFYYNKYRAVGFEPRDVENEKFFDSLPVIEKDEIRQHADQIINPKYSFRDLRETTTGGSTGMPLKTYHDPELPLDVLSWRTLSWWGVDISDSSGYLYRAVPTGLKRSLQRVFLWPTKRNWISALDMTADRMNTFYHSIKRDRASYLVGYVGAIDVFANYLEQSELKIDSLKAIWTTSAPLSKGKRKFLETIFRCPVYTQYGSCEFYWISAECSKQQGLHIANDARHVDVVDGDRAVSVGEYGDLIVTDLINRKFPLIRYRIGDRGRLLKRRCSCSLPFPLMDYVNGRISDAITMPSGYKVPGEYWTTIFDDFTEQVRSFQVYQSSDFKITISYEPNKNIDCTDVVAKIKSRLIKKLGGDLHINFMQTAVNVNDNGKTRFVISEIKR